METELLTKRKAGAELVEEVNFVHLNDVKRIVRVWLVIYSLTVTKYNTLQLFARLKPTSLSYFFGNNSCCCEMSHVFAIN